MNILSIVGARPQFVKLAPLVRTIAAYGARELGHVILHTGQHYDARMSDAFFSDLELPDAHINLGVGSGLHGAQTGEMLAGIEQVLLETRPDVAIVYGDTNSSVAGALAAAKLHVPCAHVEAGLRSFRRDMPEEINRLVADHVCDLLLAPTPAAMANLASEGLAGRARYTGDIMLDAVHAFRGQAAHASVGARIGVTAGEFGLATVHRANNTDEPGRLRDLLAAFDAIAAGGLKLFVPLHPRARQRIRSTLADWTPHPGVTLADAVGYLDMLWLIEHARVVLTDSGGVQKEAFFLSTPCVILREETEWVEALAPDANVLAGYDTTAICEAVARVLAARRTRARAGAPAATHAFGDGRAARAIVDALVARFAARHPARATRTAVPAEFGRAA